MIGSTAREEGKDWNDMIDEEENNRKSDKEKIGQVLKEREIRWVDANFLKMALTKAFEEVIDAVEKVRFVVVKAKMNIEHELLTVHLDVDRTFEEQYLKLDNRLAIMCRIVELEKRSGSVESRKSSEHSRTYLSMVEEAKLVTYMDSQVFGKIEDQNTIEEEVKLEIN